MDCLTSRILLQLQIPVLHQSLFIFKAGLLSLKVMARQKKKKKYLCQIPIKILKQHEFKFTEVKDLFIKRVQRNQSKMNYVCICSSLTQQFQNFEFSTEDITSDYGFLLRLVKTFTVDTEEYYPRCYKVNDAKTFKNLVVSFYTLC